MSYETLRHSELPDIADDSGPPGLPAQNGYLTGILAEIERYRTLVDEATDGIFVSDQAGHYVDVNPAGCDMFGYTRDEILGMTIADMIAPEETSRLQEEIARPTPTWTSEWRFRRKDGSTFEGEVHVRRLRDSRLLAVLRDVTPLQNALRALRESESRFRALIDDLDIGVVLQDADDRIVIANAFARAMLGLTPDEMSGVTSRDPRWRLVQEDVTPFPPDRVPSVLAARSRKPVRNVLVGAENLETGARRWLQVSASPRLTETGELKHVLVTIVDVTEHRAAEERLVESRRHLVASQHVAGVGSFEMEVSPEGLALVDTLTCSDECYRVFGYQPDETAAPIDLFRNRVHPDDREMLEKEIASVVSRDVFEFDHRITLPNGIVRVIHERAELVRHPVTGLPERLIGTAQDITDRLSLEEQLRQSQKMQALGQLAGGVAHDFNNLLTVITNYSDMLLHQLGDAPPDVQEALHAIHDAGDRAAVLVRQLLVFSRKLRVEPRVLDVNDIIRHATQMLRRLIPENITLNTRLAEDLAHVRMDPGQIEQLTLNLTLNARDAMAQGGVLTNTTRNAEIDAGLLPPSVPETRPGRFVQIVVSDSGTGMTPEVRSHLFEPFFTTKEVGKGTGLGLATVYGIVRASGGFIAVTSAEGVGTTITVSLPVAGDDGPEALRPSPRLDKKRGTETILLVEDEDDVRRVVRRTLETDGYTVIEAPTGKAALQILDRNEHVDMLLTDVVMPEMNGRELASRFRERCPGARVLLMSGYFQEGASSGGEGAAFAALPLLLKPFAELSAKVREVLQHQA